MLARLLPLLLVGACASIASSPAPDRPDLARVAMRFAVELRAVGIIRVVSPGNGAMVRLDTLSGVVLLAYPRDVFSNEFELVVDGSGALAAFAPGFESARDAPAVTAVLTASIRAAESNNAQRWLRANPWH